MDDVGAERLVVAMFALAVEDTKAGDSSAAAWLQSPQAIHLAESLGLDASKMLANVSKLVARHDAKPRSIDNPKDLRESFELFCRGAVGYKQITRQYGRAFESVYAKWQVMGLFNVTGESHQRARLIHEDWRRSGESLKEFSILRGLDDSELLELFRRNSLSTYLKTSKNSIQKDHVDRQYRGWQESGLTLEAYSRFLGYSRKMLKDRFQMFGYDVPSRSNA